MCEGCPAAHHFICAEPPLDPSALPDGEWLCQPCKAVAEVRGVYVLAPRIDRSRLRNVNCWGFALTMS
jgi:hypothetical protein